MTTLLQLNRDVADFERTFSQILPEPTQDDLRRSLQAACKRFIGKDAGAGESKAHDKRDAMLIIYNLHKLLSTT